MDSQILIIGVGNSLRGDDGAGPAVVKALSKTLVDPRVRLMTIHQPLPELAEVMQAAHAVILVDAHAAEYSRGAAWRPMEPAPSEVMNMHCLTPEAVVQLARMLFGFTGAAYACEIAGERFELEESLSPLAQQAIAEAIHQITTQVRAWLDKSEPTLDARSTVG